MYEWDHSTGSLQQNVHGNCFRGPCSRTGHIIKWSQCRPGNKSDDDYDHDHDDNNDADDSNDVGIVLVL